MIAWIGGALFTAKMLVNPFYAAKNPQLIAERGFVRRLPVELTMANDLPVMLDSARAHVWFSDVMLYFLDEHAHTPETVDADGHQGHMGRRRRPRRHSHPLRMADRSSADHRHIADPHGVHRLGWRP